MGPRYAANIPMAVGWDFDNLHLLGTQIYNKNVLQQRQSQICFSSNYRARDFDSSDSILMHSIKGDRDDINFA